MINISGISLEDKGRLIAEEIRRNANTSFIRRFAHRFRDIDSFYRWFRANIRYVHDKGGDILYEPYEVYSSGKGDCEDFTVFIGSVAKAMGYPVVVRIVQNSTRHVYPIIKVGNEWRVYDAVPHNIPYPLSGIPKGYSLVGDFPVDGDLSGFEDIFYKGIATGAGAAIGSFLANAFVISRLNERENKKEELSGFIDAFYREKTVEVGRNYVPKAGDILLFYFRPKLFIPDILEKRIVEWIVKRKSENFQIQRAYFTEEDGKKYLVVRVLVTGETEGLGFILTVSIIAGTIIAGLLATYFILDKVEKVVREPAIKIPAILIPIAMILGYLSIFGGRSESK